MSRRESFRNPEAARAAKNFYKFQELLKQYKKDFEGLDNPEFKRSIFLSELGAEELIKESGSEWFEFSYDQDGELYYGAVDPEDGQLLTGSSELTHWFN